MKGISFDFDKKKIILSYLICFFIVGLVCLINLSEKKTIFITTDEYGYWLSGAYFAGLDWSGTSAVMPYYSYGYGFFLSFLLRIFSDGTLLYQASIVLNVIFLWIGFVFLYKIGRNLFSQIDTRKILFLALCITLYSGNVHLSNFTMTEALLWMLMNIIIYYIIKIFEQPKTLYYIIVSVLAAYIFSVHMRTLGVSIAVIIIFSVYSLREKKNIKKELLSVLLLIVFFAICLKVKNNISIELYSSSNASDLNGIAGQVEKITNIWDISIVLHTIENIIGELFYLGSSTFFLFYFGMIFILKKSIGVILSIIKRKDIDNKDITFLFLLLIVAASVAISSISLEGRGRVDLMIYGRYNEYILPVVLFCGFIELMKGKKKIVSFFAFSIFHIIAAYLYMCVYGAERITPVLVAIPGVLGWVYENGIENFEWTVCLVPLIIGLIVMVLLNCDFLKKKTWPLNLAIIICIIVWINNAFQARNLTSLTDDYYNASSVIGNLWENTDIFYVICDEDWEDEYEITSIGCLQFLKPKSNIKMIDYKEIDQLEDNDIVILKRNSKVPKEALNGYEILWKEGYSILAKSNSDIKRKIIENINSN